MLPVEPVEPIESEKSERPVQGIFSPKIVNSVEFARSGRFIEGNFPLKWLPHLADRLLELDSSLTVSLEGSQHEGKSLLRLMVDGMVLLQCQRCLASVHLPIQINSLLQLICAGEEWPDEELMDDEMDAIEASEALDVVGLIESEMLLALPLAPRHEHCELPGKVKVAENEYGSTSFLALAALKKH